MPTKKNVDSDVDNDVEEKIETQTTLKNSSQPLKSNKSQEKQKSNKGGWKNSSANEDDRIKGTKIPSKNKGSDSESEMPYIPVLEDHEAKLGETLVSMAPQVVMNKVSTFKELDADLLKHTPLASIGGNIDLKLLTMKLLPESAVQEKDEVWDWDTLFLDVKAEYMANMSEKKS